MKNNYFVWVDDERDPNGYYLGDSTNIISWSKAYIGSFGIKENVTVVWCKNYNEFVSFIQNNGIPLAICFDHDLGYGKSGKDCANWLVNYCLDNKVNLPKYYASQSSNPSGKVNILSLLDNFKKNCKF